MLLSLFHQLKSRPTQLTAGAPNPVVEGSSLERVISSKIST